MTAPLANGPQPRASVLAIDAYVPGKSGAPGAARVHKLSSNETPLGASPKAIAAFKAAAGDLALYPEGSSRILREAIAKRYGLDPALILCGNGSDEVLHMLAQVYLGPGDEGLHSQYGFLEYPIVTRAAGATPVVAPETDYVADVDALLRMVSERTKVLFLANPNNPTGTYLSFAEVKRLHAGLPPHILLVLDAAYAEYVARNDYAAGIELVATSNNVVMTRTFSKIHGLANLRIGWAYAPAAVIDAANRVRGPFNLNGPAIAAGAAAIADTAHVDAAAAHNAHWLPWLAKELNAIGIPTTPSAGNFLLLHFPQGPHDAKNADSHLAARGFILRAVGAYGLPGCLRMTVGSEEANRGAVAALAQFMRGAA